MKTLLLIVSFLFLFSPSASYAIDSTGCGLGSVLFKGHAGTLPQTMAVTTNTSTGSQTFGISSGTLGCDPHGRIEGGTKRVFALLEKSFNQFAVEAAQGQGETIETVAHLMNKEVNETGRLIKNNFSFIFDTPDVSVVDVALRTHDLLL